MIAGLQVGLSVELHILQIIASGINSAEKSFTSQDTTTRRRRRKEEEGLLLIYTARVASSDAKSCLLSMEPGAQ